MRRSSSPWLVTLVLSACTLVMSGSIATAHEVPRTHRHAPFTPAAQTWTVRPSPNAGTLNDELKGVAGTSPSNAWAVGDYYDGMAWQTLILHWNGTSWKSSR